VLEFEKDAGLFIEIKGSSQMKVNIKKRRNYSYIFSTLYSVAWNGSFHLLINFSSGPPGIVH